MKWVIACLLGAALGASVRAETVQVTLTGQVSFADDVFSAGDPLTVTFSYDTQAADLAAAGDAGLFELGAVSLSVPDASYAATAGSAVLALTGGSADNITLTGLNLVGSVNGSEPLSLVITLSTAALDPNQLPGVFPAVADGSLEMSFGGAGPTLLRGTITEAASVAAVPVPSAAALAVPLLAGLALLRKQRA